MLINTQLKGRTIGTKYGTIKFDEHGISDELTIEQQKEIATLKGFSFVDDNTPIEEDEEILEELKEELQEEKEQEVIEEEPEVEDLEEKHGKFENLTKEVLQEIGDKEGIEVDKKNMSKKEMVEILRKG